MTASMFWEVQTGGSDANNSGGFRGGAFIAAPSAPSVSNVGSGGSVAANTYYFVYTYTDAAGDTVISAQSSTTTSGATSTITATSPSAATGALTWNCYCGTTSGGPYFPQGTALTIGSNRTITTTPPTSGTQPRGVDRSLSTSRQVIVDNSTITATTAGAASNVMTFTGGYTPSGADVGNTFRATAGTNINAGVYEITAVTTTTWTVAGSGNLTTGGGAGSAIVGGMGGCLATPGQGMAFAVLSAAGNKVFVKAGTYTLANGTVNTAGNKISVTGIGLCGYTSDRSPTAVDTPPALDAGAASMTVLTTSGSGTANLINNISITNSAARASVAGLAPGAGSFLYRRLSVSACSISMSNTGNTGTYIDCSDSNCGGMGVQGNWCNFIRYQSTGTTGTAINCTGMTNLSDCIVSGGSGTGWTGIVVGNQCNVRNCTVVGSSATNATGIQFAGQAVYFEDCLVTDFSGSGGVGYTATGGTFVGRFDHCADYNNTTAYGTNIAPSQIISRVQLTASPYTNAGSGDYSLNSTAGGGAACRAAGIPGTWAGLATTTGYRDIGAVQSQVSGATPIAGHNFRGGFING